LRAGEWLSPEGRGNGVERSEQGLQPLPLWSPCPLARASGGEGGLGRESSCAGHIQEMAGAD